MNEDEFDNLPATRETRSQRYHRQVELYAKLSGIEGVDENSEVGKLLRERGKVFQAIASPDLPPEYALKLIYLAVETEMAKNAAFTWMLKLRPPKKHTDEDALSHRQSYATATAAYKGFAQLLMHIMQLLQSGKPQPKEEGNLMKRLAELPKLGELTKK